MDEHIFNDYRAAHLPLRPMGYRVRVQNEDMSGFQNDNPAIWEKNNNKQIRWEKTSKRFELNSHKTTDKPTFRIQQEFLGWHVVERTFWMQRWHSLFNVTTDGQMIYLQIG